MKARIFLFAVGLLGLSLCAMSPPDKVPTEYVPASFAMSEHTPFVQPFIVSQIANDFVWPATSNQDMSVQHEVSASKLALAYAPSFILIKATLFYRPIVYDRQRSSADYKPYAPDDKLKIELPNDRWYKSRANPKVV